MKSPRKPAFEGRTLPAVPSTAELFIGTSWTGRRKHWGIRSSDPARAHIRSNSLYSADIVLACQFTEYTLFPNNQLPEHLQGIDVHTLEPCYRCSKIRPLPMNRTIRETTTTKPPTSKKVKHPRVKNTPTTPTEQPAEPTSTNAENPQVTPTELSRPAIHRPVRRMTITRKKGPVQS